MLHEFQNNSDDVELNEVNIYDSYGISNEI